MESNPKSEVEEQPEEVEDPIENIKVLTDKTRIFILKNLSKRNYTVSELSKILNLAKPTVLYHIKILESAGYVRRVEDDRKWVYYEITSSGESILRWKKLKTILPILSTIASAIVSFIIILLKSMRRKGVPEYPVLGVGYDWLLLISITVFIISLFVVYVTKRRY